MDRCTSATTPTGSSIASHMGHSRRAIFASAALVLLTSFSSCGARAAPAPALHAPPGFAVTLIAQNVPGARFMAVAPNGEVVVSQPERDRVVAIHPGAAIDAAPSLVISGLPL